MEVQRGRPIEAKVDHGRMLTMQEAMDFLSERNYPCRSRSTFYRLLKDFNIPYTNINPHGKHEVRRFPASGLEKFLEDQGLVLEQ